MIQLQPLSRFAIPGINGCPDVFQLCVFVTNNNMHFLGFIPDKVSNGVQVYPSPSILPRDQVKEWMPVINSSGGIVVVQPTIVKAD